ncbi:MAG: 16S rRNA (cytidine(1402)-2'-O)-methyltransferase [Pseudomonadota bacterium]
MTGILYVLATPIGNLDDLTPRARRILGEVDRIAAEDTRHTGRLLTHIGVKTPQTALHDFNEDASSRALIERLERGESVALVSDAGTPLVSDPGYRVVRRAQEAGVRVVPVPGVSAVTAALSVAGIATDRFCFEGFLPAKAKARLASLNALRFEQRTLVFFESVHRIAAALADLAEVFGPQREACIARELTKLHEQVRRAPLAELAAAAASGEIPRKGEFVIVVAGAIADAGAASGDEDKWLAELARVMPGKQAAAIVARVLGRPRNAVYQRMLELKDEQ